jgi:ABC-2 type transport system permease protein
LWYREGDGMRITKSLKLYFMYISVILRSAMQYKLSFLLMIIGRFIVAFNGFLAIYFLFSRFKGIKGYSYGDILLCFSVIQMSFALAECIASGFATFSGIVKRGDFDRILLRPRSPILQVLGTKFEIGRIGPMISALIMLIIGIQNSHLNLIGLKVFALLLMVIGGTFLFTGLFMIGATSCFFAVEDTRFINLLTYGAKEHGKYPFDIYGKGIMRLCTYIIPYTLVQYYPLQYILGLSSRWYYAFYPLGAGVFVIACYVLWRFGMKHYESCGS